MLTTGPEPALGGQAQGETARDIGRQLREARLAQGMELAQIAERMRIEPRYLQALEEGEFDPQSIRPFIKVILRRYVDLLGYDGELLLGSLGMTEANPAPAPEPERPAGRWRFITVMLVLAALVIAGLAYGADFLRASYDRLAAMLEARSSPAAPLDIPRLEARDPDEENGLLSKTEPALPSVPPDRP